MIYGSIYLIVRDFDRSLSFYKKILDTEASAVCGRRFAVYQVSGLTLCLMNGYHDKENPDQVTAKGEYSETYDNLSKIADAANTGKVFLNLVTGDLRAEHERIKALNIADQLTEIRYIEVFSPYWYFNFLDPDGNPIEITGNYAE